MGKQSILNKLNQMRSFLKKITREFISANVSEEEEGIRALEITLEGKSYHEGLMPDCT